jgi:tetratricopeptide (TPR) repeat protein
MCHGKPCWSQWRALSGVALLLLQLSATAQEKSQAQALVESALRYYESLEYERAIEELQRAQLRARTEDETVSILLHQGIILSELGRMEEATAAFESALRLRPDARLPVAVAPKIAQRFEEVRVGVEEALRTDAKGAPPSPGEHLSPPAGEPQPPALSVQATSSAAVPDAFAKRVLQPRILVPAIAGGTLLIAGGVSWGVAKSEYSRLKGDDPGLMTLSAVRSSASRGRKYQTVGFSLMGAGLVGLGLAVGLYAEDALHSPSWGVGTNGTSAFIQGRWP